MCKEKPHKKTQLVYCCQILESKLRYTYRQQLIERVVGVINDDKRIEILASVGFLVSHLINEGHNRDFLIHQIDERFFERPIKKVGAAVVRRFITSITETRRKWIVVLRVSPTLANLLKSFDDWTVTSLTDLPAHAHAPLIGWDQHTAEAQYVTRRVFAADPFEASIEVTRQLEEIKALRLLALDPLRLEWNRASYVYTSRAATGLDLLTADTPLIGRPTTKPLGGHRLRQARGLASRLYRNFDEGSRERVARALSTGAVAIDTPQDEIRLTSLWASIEVLLGDPPEDGSRISHFVATMAPCVSIRYHRRLFVALHDQLIVNYKRKFKRILYDVEHEMTSNQHTKFAKLILLQENEEHFKRLLSMCADDPFLVHRVWRLHRHYENPSNCLKTVNGHHDRVIWQLNRIYRVRNSLVHAGMSPAYTDTLVSNALEYLRGTVMTISRVSARPGSSGNIDQIFAEIGFEWKAMLTQLREHTAHNFDEKLAHSVFAAV